MMKRYLIILLLALAAMAPGATRKANAVAMSMGFGMQINSVGDFNAPLSPYGSWVTIGQWGRCWHPTHVAVGWRPYSVGSWVWTDAGWFWQSDEPWGWATFHYGSWYMDPTMGWVWIPGTDWAPAWVSWRYNNDYMGWAPIGPRLMTPATSFFVFVGMNRFHSGFRPNDLIINNRNIISRTRGVKNFQRQTVNVDGRQRTIFSNTGPGVAPIERATRQTVASQPVGEVARRARSRENLPGNQNQQTRRPGQRPGRETAPSPTGREPSRAYPQQPGQSQPEQPNKPEQRPGQRPGQRPEALPPTGREPPNNNQQPEQNPAQPPTPAQPQQPGRTRPTRPGQGTPTTPPTQSPNLKPAQPQQSPSQRPLPPTGREQGRGQQPAQQPQTRPSQPSQQQPQARPSQPQREKPLPPTGRQQAQPPSQPSQTAPSATQGQQPPAQQRQRPSQPQKPQPPQKPQQPQKQNQNQDGSGT